MDEATLAALYPSATPAAPTPSATAPTAPVTPQPAATAPADAKPAEESLEQRLERLFASPEQKAADAAAEAAKPAAMPDFIDQAHPDAAAATPIVQELGLGREQTAKLVALHEQMSAAAIDRQSNAWAAEAANLPQADVSDAQTAMRQFASPELKAILNKTGLGNNPHLIAAFARALRSNPFRQF